jgi:hypothetical protein
MFDLLSALPSPQITTLQIVSLVMVIITLIYGILSMRRYPKIAWMILSFLSLPIHALIFYIALIYVDIKDLVYDVPIFTTWSSGLRFHSTITVLSLIIFLYYGGKRWIGQH